MMSDIKNKPWFKIYILARFTFLELYRSKIFYLTALIGMGLLFATYIAVSLTYGSPERIALDFGMGMLSLSSCAIALFMGVSLISKEIETRTIYMIISRPVSRPMFILGKILGILGTLLINISILSILTLFLYFIIGGEYSSLIVWSVLFTMLESVIVLLLVISLSLISNQIISVLVTVAFYIVGHGVNEVMTLQYIKNRPMLQDFIEFFSHITPAFYKLNLKSYLLYEQILTVPSLLYSLIYSIFYIGFLFVLIIFLFKKKNFE